MTTKAGIALGFSAVLGLLVGAVITSQTLYSATAASFREYATLEALGIPRWRIAVVILVQAFWIGVAGILLALPLTLGLAGAAELLQVHVQLPPLLIGGTAALTLATALVAGLAATRSLRFIDVYSLLH
jgi:putative ABC transport system permease protein